MTDPRDPDRRDDIPANPYPTNVPALGPETPANDEPVFMLPASDPLSGMMVRFWANANEKTKPRDAARAHEFAARMDEWRRRNHGNG